ncbi:PepSY domain-containing protein [Cesiribacter andamanensis]|uniref:Putative iron-regulated membrane protein n=1 Tax=Cesiribacter andamanensis AMV16 TaxID=1279009 RepID=M7NXZ3_9BACT|nr:PepSY domain-containing protein [Cesiribacter andamanensis]EMR03234.1 putative iron-regulated membrane protein [Cesiribacter andamanensis AMV16]
MSRETEHLARHTRFYRRLHKWVAVPLLLFMLLVASTGLLLGWKKQLELLPPTQSTKERGGAWISLDSLQALAIRFAQDSLQLSSTIDRIDIRPRKGIAKVRFAEHFTELQLDGYSGAILSVEPRNSDLLEMIHDGSILDWLLGLQHDQLKLLYTSLLSVGLLLLTISGFWLWYNPRQIRRYKAPGRHTPKRGQPAA